MNNTLTINSTPEAPFGGPGSNTNNQSKRNPFIEANTKPISLREIRERHIIPVFVKDNEPAISHSDFIEVTREVASHYLRGETILSPEIRVSHPIKGRVPDARNKPAKDLLESEKTLYYERMAFILEVPSIRDNISGNELTLTIGGVKSYSLDNLYNRKGADEHFKIFIGFLNQVCTNLNISSDGFVSQLKVKSIEQLMEGILSMVQRYDPILHLKRMKRLQEFSLSEQQFAQVVGRCRMYPYLPREQRKGLPPFLFGDTQMGTVVRDYYSDNSFCREEDGRISLWKVFNLFTEANKTSYIDTFLDRAENADQFMGNLATALEHEYENWFLN